MLRWEVSGIAISHVGRVMAKFGSEPRVSIYVRGTDGSASAPVSRASHSILVRGCTPTGDWACLSACSASHNGRRDVHDPSHDDEDLTRFQGRSETTVIFRSCSTTNIFASVVTDLFVTMLDDFRTRSAARRLRCSGGNTSVSNGAVRSTLKRYLSATKNGEPSANVKRSTRVGILP